MVVDEAILQILELVIKSIGIDKLLGILFARTGKERAQEILEAEYSAADVMADRAEDEKVRP